VSNYSDETRANWRSSTPREHPPRYGKAAIENVIISKTDGVSDILEVAVLLKEVGLLRPLEHALDVNIVPLFETIGDLANSGPIMDRLLGDPALQPLLGFAPRCRNACSAIPTATRTAAS
jgi:phosphoenolpyruvate carboxylase